MRYTWQFGVGITLTIFPLLLLTIFRAPMALFGQDPDVDFAGINANGINTTATITRIEVQDNVEVNNEHPSIIHYRYQDNGKSVEDKFRTLEPGKVRQLREGGEVPIKHRDGRSIITTLEPFGVPLGNINAVLGGLMVVGLGLVYWSWRITRSFF